MAANTVLGGALAVAIAMPALALEVTQGRLENTDVEPQNWLTAFQNYSAHRYSRLSQINRDTVGGLKVAFTMSLAGTVLNGRTEAQLEGYGLVDDGLMYFDDAGGVIYKIDVRTGNRAQMVWRADSSMSPDERARSRGGAFWGNAYYANLRDGRVVAVDRDTGEFIWDKQIARVEHPKYTSPNKDVEGFTASPLAVEGKILVGQSKGDSGANGWLAAIDAETGEELWRTFTIPLPGEFGHDTWADDHGAWKTGGASLWTQGSYDPEQRVTIWGAAQPVPMFDPEFRPGDNLYSNSALAFNIDDGSIEWYFQYVPNESWDYDEQGVHMLIDAPYGGQDRQMVVHWGRNGFYYQLDRTNGNFISATQYVDKVNWTAGIDPKTGMPVEYDPSLTLQAYIPATRWARADEGPKQACPALEGGVRWQPPAYNPEKRIAYEGGEDGCQTRTIQAVISVAGGGNIEADREVNPGGRTGGKTSSTEGLHGLIAAIDVTTGKVLARLRQPYSNKSGLLATAGGLLFTATVDGTVSAHHDETLEEMWRFNTGITMKAAPTTYMYEGKQYIAVFAGGRVSDTRAYPDIADQVPGAMLYVFAL
jgi:alcohol dehydrogenase (cytochrome c)